MRLEAWLWVAATHPISDLKFMISVDTSLTGNLVDINGVNTRCLKCAINHYCTYNNQKYLIPIDLIVPNSYPYMDPILYIRPPTGMKFFTSEILGSKIVPIPNLVDSTGRITYFLVNNIKNVRFSDSSHPDHSRSVFRFSRQMLRHLLPYLQRSSSPVFNSALFSLPLDSSSNAAPRFILASPPNSTRRRVLSPPSLTTRKSRRSPIPSGVASSGLWVRRSPSRSKRKPAAAFWRRCKAPSRRCGSKTSNSKKRQTLGRLFTQHDSVSGTYGQLQKQGGSRSDDLRNAFVFGSQNQHM